jgi:hypothetical protein
VDVTTHVDDRAPAATATASGQPGESAHPWHRWDDGRLWREIYLVRSAMLVAFAAASWLSGSVSVALMVLCLVLPFNMLVGRDQPRRGRSRRGT